MQVSKGIDHAPFDDEEPGSLVPALLFLFYNFFNKHHHG